MFSVDRFDLGYLSGCRGPLRTVRKHHPSDSGSRWAAQRVRAARGHRRKNGP